MPLSKGKSKAAFSRNVSTEMRAGKPQNQALAIAYSIKRKKMAQGGVVEHRPSAEEDKDFNDLLNTPESPTHYGPMDGSEDMEEEIKRTKEASQGETAGANDYAKGGRVFTAKALSDAIAKRKMVMGDDSGEADGEVIFSSDTEDKAPDDEAISKRLSREDEAENMSDGGMALLEAMPEDRGVLEDEDENDELSGGLMGGQSANQRFLTAKMPERSPSMAHYPDPDHKESPHLEKRKAVQAAMHRAHKRSR